MKQQYLKICLLVFLVQSFALRLYSQCTSPINSFPYTENFEASNGGWTTGGTSSDWAWGAPSKPTINAAGQGTNCWITGGLTGSSYANGERSWLQSPCFDFTGLQYPFVRFLVYWETERQFDGATFQYSLDGGATWTNVGSSNEQSFCLNQNWFNYNPINNLSGLATVQDGWSGTVQPTTGSCRGTGGSGGWVIASHVMPFLAGQVGVIFRFAFGAGTQCNAYDGFAIDDFRITEAPHSHAFFTYTCGADNLVQFTQQGTPCPDQFSWDFGDLASGSSNFDNNPNPSHVFSGPGQYTVTLTVSNSDNSVEPATFQQIINIVDLNFQVTNPVKCYGDNSGAVVALVTGQGAPFTYNWNTIPAQSTAAISGLSAGTYVITVGGTNVCQVKDSVTLLQPPAFLIGASVIDAGCNASNGSIKMVVGGGTPGYHYQWSPSGIDSNLNENLAAGFYDVRITDANGCIKDSNGIEVKNIINSYQVSLGNDTTICPGDQLVLSPGTFSSYLWQDNSASPTFTVTQTGIYNVTVKDASGCPASARIEVTVDCPDLFFPNAFTPNNDGTQDVFGPRGRSFNVAYYRLVIFNRWGQQVFESVDPLMKWDGDFHSKKQPAGTYIWRVDYQLPGKNLITKNGYVVLFR